MDEQINGMVETIQQLEKENADLKLRLGAVSGSFDHEIIEKVRNSQSDAEARRYLQSHIQNYH